MKNRIRLQEQAVRNDFLRTVVIELVRRRKKLGITQEALNYRLGVADRLVSKWECGTRTPKLYHLYLWAFALGVKIKVEANDNFPTKSPYGTSGPSNDNKPGSIK